MARTNRLADVGLALERGQRTSIRQRRQIKARREEQRRDQAARQHEASQARHSRRKQWEAEMGLREQRQAQAEATGFEAETYRRTVVGEERADLRKQRGREWALRSGAYTAKTGMVLEDEPGKGPRMRGGTAEEMAKLGVPEGGLDAYEARTRRTAAKAASDLAAKREERLGGAAKRTMQSAQKVQQFRQQYDPEARLTAREIQDITTTMPEEKWGEAAGVRLLTQGSRDAVLSQLQGDPDIGQYAIEHPEDVKRVIMQNMGKGSGEIHDEVRKAKKQQDIHDDLTTMQESQDAGMRMAARQRLAVNGVASPKNYAEEMLHKTILGSTKPSDRETELQKQADRARQFALDEVQDENDLEAQRYSDAADRLDRKRKIMASSRKKMASYMRENEEFLLDYLMGNRRDVAQRIEMLSGAAESARTNGREDEAAKLDAAILATVPGGAMGIAAMSQLGPQFQGALQQMIATPEITPEAEGGAPQAAGAQGQPQAGAGQPQPDGRQITSLDLPTGGQTQQPAAQPQQQAAPQPVAQPQAQPGPEEVPPEPGAALTEDDLPPDPQQRANVLATLKQAKTELEAATQAAQDAETPEERNKARMKAIGLRNALDRYINDLRPLGKLEEF